MRRDPWCFFAREVSKVHASARQLSNDKLYTKNYVYLCAFSLRAIDTVF